ncbi:MAG: plasmid recombination protein, partial [Lachnospiraceae bacterium]|nr:plasmid recombination protein [Lachnospiraceae bacterium]
KNKALSASLDKANEGSVLKQLEDTRLRRDYEAAVQTLDRIPKDVLDFYCQAEKREGDDRQNAHAR